MDLYRIGVLIPRRWRQLNRWWAHRCGLFWLECPKCGEYFGGHECGPLSAEVPVRGQRGVYRSVCWKHGRRKAGG